VADQFVYRPKFGKCQRLNYTLNFILKLVFCDLDLFIILFYNVLKPVQNAVLSRAYRVDAVFEGVICSRSRCYALDYIITGNLSFALLLSRIRKLQN
jgi:hypothetical protein